MGKVDYTFIDRRNERAAQQFECAAPRSEIDWTIFNCHMAIWSYQLEDQMIRMVQQLEERDQEIIERESEIPDDVVWCPLGTPPF
jgi:protein-disulfide isomerase